jgi:hypothetical protein
LTPCPNFWGDTFLQILGVKRIPYPKNNILIFIKKIVLVFATRIWFHCKKKVSQNIVIYKSKHMFEHVDSKKQKSIVRSKNQST